MFSSSFLQRFQLFLILAARLYTCSKNHTQWPRTQACHLQLSTQIQLHQRKPSHWALWQHRPPASYSSSIPLLMIFWLSCSAKMVSVGGRKPQGQPWGKVQLLLGSAMHSLAAGQPQQNASFHFTFVSHNSYLGTVSICHQGLKLINFNLSWLCCGDSLLFILCWNPLSIKAHREVWISEGQFPHVCHLCCHVLHCSLVKHKHWLCL